MYKFNKESKIVKSWVISICAGNTSIDDIPALFNLKEVVTEVLKEKGVEI